jgi:hypothetical protein
MRDGESLHESGKLFIVFRPENQVPMIWPQTKAADPHGARQHRFFDDLLKRFVVPRLVKQPTSSHASIENMINITTRCYSS